MNKRLELTLAFKFLLSKKRGKFLSLAALVAILGMGFGVAALLVALSVISGFQKEYKKAILGFNSHVIVMKADEIGRPEKLAIELSHQQEGALMHAWTPFIYREGMAIAGSKVKGIVLKGIDFSKYIKLSHIQVNEEFSENPEHLSQVLLGKSLANELMLKDHTVRVLFPQGLRPEELGSKNIRRFHVAGTFESGLYEYDSSFAFIPLEDAKKFFETDGKVSGLEIWLSDSDQADTWAKALRKDYPYPFTVTTWRELNENVFRALEMEKFLFFILMAVLIAVASLNIIGTLLMLILEKKEEVSILRAMGMAWRNVTKIFLFDGLLIGSLGILMGIILGLGLLLFEIWRPIPLPPEVYFVDRVPVVFSWVNLFWVVAVALLVTFIGCRMALKKMSQVKIVH